LTPYIIPPLGKHYLERWEEEDLGHEALAQRTEEDVLAG
jgi:hypothetical protein